MADFHAVNLSSGFGECCHLHFFAQALLPLFCFCPASPTHPTCLRLWFFFLFIFVTLKIATLITGWPHQFLLVQTTHISTPLVWIYVILAVSGVCVCLTFLQLSSLLSLQWKPYTLCITAFRYSTHSWLIMFILLTHWVCVRVRVCVLTVWLCDCCFEWGFMSFSSHLPSVQTLLQRPMGNAVLEAIPSSLCV